MVRPGAEDVDHARELPEKSNKLRWPNTEIEATG